MTPTPANSGSRLHRSPGRGVAPPVAQLRHIFDTAGSSNVPETSGGADPPREARVPSAPESQKAAPFPHSQAARGEPAGHHLVGVRIPWGRIPGTSPASITSAQESFAPKFVVGAAQDVSVSPRRR